ncbi:MAG: DUF4956 domain-containing protein [Bacilli bacterium]|jgi:uncharacterized membrane protein YhiD involved in acid resistance|nr:DUF4956 domain-containing protein [Bacilli bacterium]
MKDKLIDLLEVSSSTLTLEQITMHLFVAVILGFAIFLSYYITHEGTIYSKKFNVSLVMLTVLTTMVMTVIGNNIALSLGMVGALSIVRFRTAIKDSRDTAYIFWTIIVGICCGVGDYVVASLGTVTVFLIMMMLGRIKNDNRILVIIKTSLSNERKVEGIVFEYFMKKANLKVKNTTDKSIEFIYELPKKYYTQSLEKEKSITEALYELKNVEYVNIVSQNDEISG